MLIFEETFTAKEYGDRAEAILSNAGYLDYPEAEIEFDGVKYEAQRQINGIGVRFGDSNLTEYPFYLSSSVYQVDIQCQNPGTHTIRFYAEPVSTNLVFSETVTMGSPQQALAYDDLIAYPEIEIVINGKRYPFSRKIVQGAAYGFNEFGLHSGTTEDYPFSFVNTLACGTGELTVELYGDEGDPGVLFEETINAEAIPDFPVASAKLAYAGDASTFIYYKTIEVEFDGVKYTVERRATYGGGVIYGAEIDAGTPDFSVYPFAITSYGDSQTGEIINEVLCKDAGEHTIKVTVLTSEEPEGNLPCEYPSIKIDLVPEPRYGGVLVVTAIDGKLNATWNQINNAYQNGLVTILGEGLVTEVSEYNVTAANTYTADSANGYPKNSGIS